MIFGFENTVPKDCLVHLKKRKIIYQKNCVELSHTCCGYLRQNRGSTLTVLTLRLQYAEAYSLRRQQSDLELMISQRELDVIF